MKGLLVFLCFLLASPLMVAQASTDLTALSSYVLVEMEKARIPGWSLSVFQGSETLYFHSSGKTPTGSLVDENTPFLIGSLAKTLTAYALLQLVQEQKLELDHPVSTYLPWFVLDKESAVPLRVRDLLNHTSGLSSAEDRFLLVPDSLTSLQDQARRVNALGLAHEPSQKMSYSNWNYVVLGALLEEVTGISFGDYMETQVFSPLGMGNSFANPKTDAVLGYQWFFGFPLQVMEPHREEMAPAGYLFASALDLSRFLSSLDGSSLKTQVLKESAHIEEGTHYAMGLGILKIGDKQILFHEGMTPTHYAVMLLEVTTGFGLVLLSNTSNLYTPKIQSTIAWNAMSRLLQEEALTTRSDFQTFQLLIVLVSLGVLLLMVWRGFSLWTWFKKMKRESPPSMNSLLSVVPDLIFPILALVVIPQGAEFPFWPAMFQWQKDVFVLAITLVVCLLCFATLRVILFVKASFVEKKG